MAADQQTGNKREPDLQGLVQNAPDDTVTVDKLIGEEKYYPDASKIFEWPRRVSGETLQYVVLLTKTGKHLKITEPTTDFETTISGIGSLVFTDRAVYHATTEDSFEEYPYDEITRTRADFSSRKIYLYIEGREYKFFGARSGDDENRKRAYAYLQQKVYE